jgi:soluble lytic murein transglycosylase-like protein/outer membrane protein assembly factor BamD (BamD/ComL family)
MSLFSRILFRALLVLPAFPAAAKVYPEAPTSRDVRAFQIEWQSALLDARAGRFDKASKTLQALDPRDSLTPIYRASFLAETYLAAGKRRQAAETLDALLGKGSEFLNLDPVMPRASFPPAGIYRYPVWVRHLYRIRLQADSPLDPARERFKMLARMWDAPLDDGTRVQVLYRLFGLDSSVGGGGKGVLGKLVSLAPPNARLDSVYRAVSPAYALERSPDHDWQDQKLMLDLEEKLGLWQKAIDRGQVLVERATAPGAGRSPGEAALKSLQLKIALWYFNKGSYAESIRRYDQWRERYGDTPEVLLQIARAYRNLSQDGKAQTVYSRLLEQFPADSRAAEVIWMRTFDAEALGRTEDAIEGYTRVIEGFPQHARAGEAMFRIGLAYYKRGDFEAAQKSFRDLRNAQKTGRLAGAARYWEGKSLAKRGLKEHDAEARAVWRDLAAAYPFGYYGHQARRELAGRGAWPDSLDWNRRLRHLPDGAVRAWMLAAMPGAREVPERAGESPYLPLAKLLSLGMDSLAVLTLQSQVGAAPGNPWVLYTAATRARAAGFDYEAYRFGVRLSDRLPLEAWPRAPLSVLQLFYPPSYESIVRMEATRAGISPWLVLALIKQESGFEPRAVSRVGARGLMQMMPATGVLQARKEKMADFDPDSLFIPRVNTRLGIAYLRDVLRRYGGNPYYALAHYNAGPNALERWLPRLNGRPIEEGVEDIGYAETRDYVKRVMANYWTYQELYN